MADLTRLIVEAKVLAGAPHDCVVLGHRWVFRGGCACCCEDGSCSLPVNECEACGDCDYGDNAEATAIFVKCKETRDGE